MPDLWIVVFILYILRTYVIEQLDKQQQKCKKKKKKDPEVLKQQRWHYQHYPKFIKLHWNMN